MTDEAHNPSSQILVVDDEVEHAEVMAEALRRLGHVCTIVHDLDKAKDELQHGQFDLIVTDLVMDKEDDGLQVLATARQTQPMAETILVTAHGDVPTCKAALKQGAYDFIEKPLDLDVFRTLVQHAIQAVTLRQTNTHLRQRLDETYGFEGILGSSPAIRSVIATMRQIAPSNIPVLITGASRASARNWLPRRFTTTRRDPSATFVPLNCAGLSESILEDELFGHVKGAFTGADRDREGRFEYANGGTLFLDEVGDMPLLMQAKLLRVLENGEVIRLGANEPRNVDVRLISATNRDLETMVKNNEFREDLFYRIKGVGIHLPALRQRREDIPILARHFAHRYADQIDKPIPELTEDTQALLTRYDWPGNVRQLMNVIQNMVVVAQEDRLEPRHLPGEIHAAAGDDGQGVDIAGGLSLEQIEKQAIRNTLRLTQGNREQAAKMLGIGERTLYRKLKEYGLK